MTNAMGSTPNTSNRVVNGPPQKDEKWDRVVNGPCQEDEKWDRLVNGPTDSSKESVHRGVRQPEVN